MEAPDPNPDDSHRDGVIVVRLWSDGNRTGIRARVIEVELEDTIETATVCDGIDAIVGAATDAIVRFAVATERPLDRSDDGDGLATQW